MASLIAGHGHGPGGGSGVIGVAPRSTILSIRVIPDRADPHYRRYEHEQEPNIQDSLARGIDFAVQHGAKVISMSIGYSAPNGAVKQALQEAFSHGVVVVASAGNSGAPAGTNDAVQAPVSFPADYPGVISVGAVNMAGKVASFSSENLSVRVAAPGVSVLGPGPGRAVLVGQRHQPGLRAGGRGGGPDQVEVPGSGTQPGRQRADLDHHEPAARRLRHRGGVRHRRRGRGPGPGGQGGQAGRRPARSRPASRRRPGSAAARSRSRPHRCTGADPASWSCSSCSRSSHWSWPASAAPGWPSCAAPPATPTNARIPR